MSHENDALKYQSAGYSWPPAHTIVHHNRYVVLTEERGKMGLIFGTLTMGSEGWLIWQADRFVELFQGGA